MADILSYKGHKLQRVGNEIYYGDINQKYVVHLQLTGGKDVADLKVAEKVGVKLMLTDDSLPIMQRIIKHSEKAGLYNALDIGFIWLERALKEA